MSWVDSIRTRVQQWLGIDAPWVGGEYQDRINSMAYRADYYAGNQARPFVVRWNKPNDNIIINYVRLMINKNVSMLLGKGIEFNMAGNDDDDWVEYIGRVWVANKKDILLQELAQFAGIYGTGYIKIIPDGLADNQGELPRLVALNPMHWSIETDPEDIDRLVKYIGRFATIGPDGSTVARRSIVEVRPEGGWLLSEYWNVGNQWVRMTDDIIWEYDFPPILHFKNLPNAGEVYGQPDYDNGAIELQDRINYIASNISKIIRLQAHPRMYTIGAGAGDIIDWSPDRLMKLPTGSSVGALEMQSDLMSSKTFLDTVRQAFFDTTQTVDLASIKDKVGQLTNFGLKVLYIDAVAKIEQKREILGDALVQLNRRLLDLADYPTADAGEVVWPSVLPTNKIEDNQSDAFEIDNKLVSKQTVATRRGYDYIDEQTKINEETQAGQNVGANVIRDFLNGTDTGSGLGL